MKVWLDDVRTPPGSDWTWVKTPTEAIELLETENVDELSLDHDLGLQTDGREATGYDVLAWMEEAVVTRGFKPPGEIRVHSANVAAVPRMEAALASIRRLAAPEVDTALLRAYNLGMDEAGWTDAVMDEAELLLPILVEAGYAARDDVAQTWWFTDAGVARANAIEKQAGL